MTSLLLSDISFNSSEPAVVILLWALVAVGILLAAAMVFAIVTKILVAITYSQYNKVKCQKNLPAHELTTENLKHCKLENVKVEKANWLRSLLGLNVQSYGNSYSAYKKKIFLRKNIMDKNSVTAYAVSTNKVAHAVMDDKKQNQFYYKVKPLMVLAPVLLIPFMILGLVLDFTVGPKTLGVYTLAFAIVSAVLFLLSFVLLLITIPIEKKANKKAREILKETNSVTDDEMVGIKKVHNAYILSYVADFIYALIQLIWDILRIALKVANKAKK